ncbi:MAG: 50S ribosomal protein L22 [Armatimonadota bacterium]
MGKNAQERGSRKAARIEQRRVEGIALASARNIRMSPLKVRRVIDLIRGKDYQEAVDILNFTPNIAAEPIRKVVKSAAANAENNLSLEPERLYIKACFVDGGFTFKRIHPTTMGRVRHIARRTSHITVQLAERPRRRATTSRAEGRE